MEGGNLSFTTIQPSQIGYYGRWETPIGSSDC